MSRVLVVDDDAGFRSSLVESLTGLGYETAEAGNGADALALLAGGNIDAVILDYRLGLETGTQVLQAARERLGGGLPPVLVLTAFADARGTIEAMRLGAFDHLSKPVGRAQLEAFLKKAVSTGERVQAPHALPDDPFIGISPAMRDVHKLIGRAAASDATVLITGETGTGKELVARALHDFSGRSAGPFIAVNSAAIPAELLESELFGHSKGAFSGAASARAGCFEQASGGTLLLDEIGDMPLTMQAKVLRVLQERCVTRLGESTERQLDVRIVAASHRDLERMVDAGAFRQDLYFRLNVLRIHLPPLRERREDIVPLALFFLSRSGAEPRALSSDARRMLEAAPWPGNVRELRNAMERARVMVSGTLIDAADLSFMADPERAATPDAPPDKSPDPPMRSAVASLERSLIAAALAEAQGNRSDAARRLGISRAQLYRKLRSLGIAEEE